MQISFTARGSGGTSPQRVPLAVVSGFDAPAGLALVSPTAPHTAGSRAPSGPTSSLLMGTEGCRRFPISRRLSKRSASSLTRSASHLRMASSIRRRTFLIWDTCSPCVQAAG